MREQLESWAGGQAWRATWWMLTVTVIGWLGGVCGFCLVPSLLGRNVNYRDMVMGITVVQIVIAIVMPGRIYHKAVLDAKRHLIRGGGDQS